MIAVLYSRSTSTLNLHVHMMCRLYSATITRARRGKCSLKSEFIADAFMDLGCRESLCFSTPLVILLLLPVPFTSFFFFFFSLFLSRNSLLKWLPKDSIQSLITLPPAKPGSLPCKLRFSPDLVSCSVLISVAPNRIPTMLSSH